MVSDVTGVGDNCLIRNENTNLTCTVTGVPTPTVEWFRSSNNDDRETITPNDKFTVMGNILIINMVTNDDNGIYGCIGTNTIDGVEKTNLNSVLFTVCSKLIGNLNYYFLLIQTLERAYMADHSYLKF